MKDFEAIKELWKGQMHRDLHAEKIMRQIRASNQYYAQKLWMQSFLVGISLLVLLGVSFFGHFHTWTTYIALLILSVCILYYLVLQIKDYKSLHPTLYHELAPTEFIQYLKEYQQKSHLLNYTHFGIYLGGVSVAFILLLIELYFILPLWMVILFFAATAIWFSIAWLTVMKRYIRQKNKHFETMINRLKQMEEQFHER